MHPYRTIYFRFLALLIIGLYLSVNTGYGQLSFTNPILESGTALQNGAVYRFSNIAPGIDALVTIVSRSHPDVAVENIDLPGSTFGHDVAWQPQVDGNFFNDPGCDTDTLKFADFKIEFVTSGSSAQSNINDIYLTSLDMDGNGNAGHVREYIMSDDFDSYSVGNPSSLTITNSIEVLAPVTGYAGIDTSAQEVMITLYYISTSEINMRVGAKFGLDCSGMDDSQESRLSSFYFKEFSLPIEVSPAVGNYVWVDTDGDGLQEPGENGVDGIMVKLYADTNGNSISEPDQGDVAVDSTYTVNGGQYLFSAFPLGDYFITFSNISGYIPTSSYVGSNPNIDSDGLVSDVYTFTGSTINHSIDLGLIDLTEKCYAIGQNSNGVLMSWDSLGNITQIGQLGVDEVETMTFNYDGSQLFAMDDGTIGTVNINSGLFSSCATFGVAQGNQGNILIDDVDGMAIDNTTGLVYAVHRRNGAQDLLLSINLGTCSIVPDAFGNNKDYVRIGGSLNDIDDIAFNPCTGVLYGSATDLSSGADGQIVTIKLNNGNATVVATLTETDIEGLTFNQNCTLFGSTGDNASQIDNTLYLIDIDAETTSAIATFPVGDVEAIACYIPAPDPNNPCTSVMARDDIDTTLENTVVLIDILDNDEACTGNLQESSVDTAGLLAPSLGTITNISNSTGIITYSPDFETVGLDSFQYLVCNTGSQSGCDTAMVYVLIHCGLVTGVNNISGTVYTDSNLDTIFDNTELGIPSVTVRLYEDMAPANGIPDGAAIQSDVTDGNGDYDFSLSLTYDQPFSYSQRISQFDDDARQKSNGDVDNNGNELKLGKNETVGLRFQNVNIPANATIDSAFVTFNPKDDGQSTSVNIFAERNSNAATFIESNYNISGRSLSASNVSWAPSTWTQDVPNRTGQLKTVIQEVVNSQSGINDLVLVFFPTGSEENKADSYDQSTSDAPLLQLYYTTNVGGNYNYIVRVDTSTVSGGAVLPSFDRSVMFNEDGEQYCNENFGVFYEDCTNGIDDDQDGLVDCDDPDCQTASTSVTSTDPSICNAANGTITLTFSGGLAPFNYLWTNGINNGSGTTGNITNLSAGLYSITVSDSECYLDTLDIQLLFDGSGCNPGNSPCFDETDTYAILGLDGGSVIVNSATNIIGDVGYSRNVTSNTNQKAGDSGAFNGTAYVHTNVTSFNYNVGNFLPSGGVMQNNATEDARLDAANTSALAFSAFFAGATPDVVLGVLGDNDNRTVNRVDSITIVEITSLDYNNDELTLIGSPGLDDAFVINVLGDFDFSASRIILTNVRPERVVFNFPNASNIVLNKATNVFNGTILAPTGSIVYHNSAIFNGAIIGLNLNLHSSFNIYHAPLDIPCPADVCQTATTNPHVMYFKRQ